MWYIPLQICWWLKIGLNTSMLIGDRNFVFIPWILPGRHCIPLEISFDFPVILKIEVVNARSTQGCLDFPHSKKKTSILFSCLVPHSSLLPSPPSHQFCLFGITIGSVGTSEDQFVPSLFCPHQTRAVDSSGGPPWIYQCRSPGSSDVQWLVPFWCFRLWLSVIEVVPERLYRNCSFHGMLTLR